MTSAPVEPTTAGRVAGEKLAACRPSADRLAWDALQPRLGIEGLPELERFLLMLQ